MRITGAESDEITEVRWAQWWKMLGVSLATLKKIRNFTGNQGSCCRAAVMWDCRLRPRISRAPAFWIFFKVARLTPNIFHHCAYRISANSSLSGTVSRISSGTRRSALTLSDVYWRRICLRDTSECSALEVDNFMCYINLLTYLLLDPLERRQSRCGESNHHWVAVVDAWHHQWHHYLDHGFTADVPVDMAL